VPKAINCKADRRFQVRILVPSRTELVPPAAGAITGVTLRLAATETGPAIHAAVGGLAATEDPGMPGLFYVEVDAALLTTHVLPLGVGASFWAIWSKSGDFDMETTRFIVADHHDVT